MEKREWSKINYKNFRILKKNYSSNNYKFHDIIQKHFNSNEHSKSEAVLISRFCAIKYYNYFIDSPELLNFFESTKVNISKNELYKLAIKKSISSKGQNTKINTFHGIIHTLKAKKSLFFDIEIIFDELDNKEYFRIIFTDGETCHYFTITDKTIEDLNNKNFIKNPDYENPDYENIDIPENIIENEANFLQKKSKLILNMLLYMNAFHMNILNRPPMEILDKKNKNNSKSITISKEISKYLNENRDVSPHLRRGHFRYLSSDYYKNKKGATIFVNPAFIKGKAKTVKDTK